MEPSADSSSGAPGSFGKLRARMAKRLRLADMVRIFLFVDVRSGRKPAPVSNDCRWEGPRTQGLHRFPVDKAQESLGASAGLGTGTRPWPLTSSPALAGRAMKVKAEAAEKIATK